MRGSAVRPAEYHHESIGRWIDYCAQNIAIPRTGAFMHSPWLVRPAAQLLFAARRIDTASELEAEYSAKRRELLSAGKILAVKGLGGYHLACDARMPHGCAALRERKFRKEKPFALMAKDVETARSLVELSPEAEALLTSTARPIVLAPAQNRSSPWRRSRTITNWA